MIVRKGEANDVHAILNLIIELAVFEQEPNAVLITQDDLLRDGFSSNPLFYTFVVEHNHNIIGMALYYYRYSTWKGKTIHLEDLIVKKEFRGIGAGFALFCEIIKQGKKDNVKRMEWNVLNWNKNAIDFYENMGAKMLADWRVVHIDNQGIENFLTKNNL